MKMSQPTPRYNGFVHYLRRICVAGRQFSFIKVTRRCEDKSFFSCCHTLCRRRLRDIMDALIDEHRVVIRYLTAEGVCQN